MPFEKGKSGNPGGRKKGSANISTREFKLIVSDILSTAFTKRRIMQDLKDLPPKIRLDMVLKLLEFIVPKASSQNVIEEDSEKKSLMDKLIAEQTKYALSQLKNKTD